MSAPVIEVQRLARSFGGRRAVDGVDFRLAAGDCLALFGPNGAGKTTLLRLLAGLLKPSGGTARIDGVALPGGPELRARIGLISHASMLYAALTARENVEFAARLYGLPDPRGAARAALERMRILHRAETPVRALSRGLQQRVSIARATVHLPHVVLLDEPFTGLDQLGAGALTEMLRELRATGHTLVLVTHNIQEGLALATHTAIMHEGRLVRFDDEPMLDGAAYGALYRQMVAGGA